MRNLFSVLALDAASFKMHPCGLDNIVLFPGISKFVIWLKSLSAARVCEEIMCLFRAGYDDS